jgi:hypothetical protein
VKFSTLNSSKQGNNTNIILVSNKAKTCIGKLGLWVRKLEGKSLDMFSRFKDFVEENSLETSDTGIISVSKIIWLICSPGFLDLFQKQ